MRKNILGAIALTLGFAAGAAAQTRPTTKMAIQDSSRLWIEGTSSLHAWHCTASTVKGDIQLDDGYATRSLAADPKIVKAVAISIPVKEMTCGHGDKMDGNMYKALKANDNPTIEYTLTGYELTAVEGDAEGFVVHARGTLTIAGQTKEVAMVVSGRRGANGTLTVQGSQPVLMTDFGVKPPTAMLGTIKAGNEVTVRFDLRLAPAPGQTVGSR
ncbi:MAG TPA: YceI family protein [Gemmatimonadaceae bacterium]|nr:YceI family protein [Gemmatimonadaceae bacterium]